MLGTTQLVVLLTIQAMAAESNFRVDLREARARMKTILPTVSSEQLVITINRLKARGFLASSGQYDVRYIQTQGNHTAIAEAINMCKLAVSLYPIE